jgi:hypothetical protein
VDGLEAGQTWEAHYCVSQEHGILLKLVGYMAMPSHSLPLQAALSRSKSELATQRENYEKISVDLKSAEGAQHRAQSDLLTVRRKLDDTLTKSNKSGEIWETMMKDKQEREQEVNDLKEEIVALALQRDTAGTRVETLEQDKRDLQVEKSLAHQRVCASHPASVTCTCLQGASAALTLIMKRCGTPPQDRAPARSLLTSMCGSMARKSALHV